ncbi:DUF5682 family protein [Inquilinus sp. CA228]|uniref:DUF5682 family protein n=1 Tax=Inquilinus sp. CA228 TaxID=3455609 RepID=UPI003F8D7A6A
MDPRVHLFGIRHHGPGSAASLVAALDALQPATVLIEGPPEADPLIPYAASPGMKAPLALLAYAADEPGRSVFFPLADFSPEWQAMRWAVRNGRPVSFIDWPAAASLADRSKSPAEPPEPDAAPAGEDAEEAEEPPPARPAGDPLDRLAEISGHADGEAFWNALVESRGAAIEVFAAIEAAMTALRAEVEATAPAEAREVAREAHMRLKIRQALKDGDGAIAVVVGAWHVPVLRRKTAAAEDRAILKDLPKAKVEVTWVPWTDTRLATASGYGAGVPSPGWYAHLWSLYDGAREAVAPDAFAATWQAKVAGLLRGEGYPAATASVIEAARLAVGLAAIRGQPVPGLAEMRDATLAALCHGDEAPFRVIESRLVVGQSVGEVDDSVPQMPLAQDLARWQRRLRLKPEALEQEAALDLRSDAGLAKSTLLHRLDLMGVPWGRIVDAAAGRGTFREIWRLAWAPELSVRLAEALVHGITIEQAAAGSALARAEASTGIHDLAGLVRRCLLADLPDAAERCIARLQAAAVNAVDVAGLMLAVPPLVSILRYGTARKIPVEALSSLAKAMTAEIHAGLAVACANLDDASAGRMREAMTAFDAAQGLLADEHLDAEWLRRLRSVADDTATVPLLAGLALRRLYDRSALREDEVAAAFSRALSPAVPPKAVGTWLEGFLGGNAEVILQDPALFGLVDGWLEAQDDATFTESLPMLRRSFGTFGAAERRRLLAEVGKGRRRQAATPAVGTTAADSPAFREALPLLLTILGMTRRD